MAEGLISISTEVWEKKLAEYIVTFNLGMREALNEEWPLLIRKVMDFTPPFKTKDLTSGKRGGDNSFSASDLAVGRAATGNDIYKTMNVFNPKARSKDLQHIMDTKNFAAFNIIARLSKSPYMKDKRAIAFSPTVHLSQRNRRGRVPGKDQRVVVLGSDSALLKKYVADVQSRVGYAKSGWWIALALVRGSAPSYVTRHGFNGGDCIDDRANEDEPSITAINRTPWAVRKDEGDRILADAHASRIEAIRRKIIAKTRLAAQQAKLEAA